MEFRLLVVGLLLGLGTGAALGQEESSPFSRYSASDLEAYERGLEQEYLNKILTLRHFDRRERIDVDADGEIKGTIKPGPWTTHGKIEIVDVTVKRDRVDFQGRRLWVRWDEEKKEFQYLGTKHRVRVRFRLPRQGLDGAWLEEAFLKVFLGNEEELADIAPSWWQPFLAGEMEEEEKEEKGQLEAEEIGRGKLPSTGVYRIGGEVSPPRCLSCPDPEYVPEARAAKIEGTVVLWAIVNKQGRIENVRIVRPVGLGLDDQAVNTVQRWKLGPGRREGKPVGVYIRIDMKFDLYE